MGRDMLSAAALVGVKLVLSGFYFTTLMVAVVPSL